MKRLLLLPLLLVPFSLSAQKPDSFLKDLDGLFQRRSDLNYASSDTTYIGRYDYRFDARLFYRTSGLHLCTEGLGNSQLSTGLQNKIGIGLAYRGVGLAYSIGLGDNTRRSLSLGLDGYGKHFGFEWSYNGSKGLTGSFEIPGWEPIQAGKGTLMLMANTLNLFYIFNPRFSYSAAMKQQAIQRRSAGSFIAGINWSVWDIVTLPEGFNLRENFIPELYKNNYLCDRISIGTGYGYNLVLGRQHWLLHASLVPMWTVYDATVLRKDWEKTRVARYFRLGFTTTARTGVYYRWGDRWSIGCSGVINQMSSHRRNVGVDGTTYPRLRFGSQHWQTNLSLGYRF